MSNEYRQYNKRQHLRRRRMVRRFLKRIGALLLMFCICVGLIWTLKDISALYDNKNSASIESLHVFKKDEYEKKTNYFNRETDSRLIQELQELAENNEETGDFVEDYPNRDNYLGLDIDLSDELNDVRNFNEVPLLMQWDKRWGYEEYGDSIMGLSGCGPACLSMVYLYFTQDSEGNPKEMGIFCEESGYYTEVGTSWELWTEGVTKLGLSGQELSLDETVMRKALNNGNLIVCSMRPGDFTTTGHYILIYSCNDQGFMINDPNRKSNSEKIWSYDVLKGQIKNLWAIGE